MVQRMRFHPASATNSPRTLTSSAIKLKVPQALSALRSLSQAVMPISRCSNQIHCFYRCQQDRSGERIPRLSQGSATKGMGYHGLLMSVPGATQTLVQVSPGDPEWPLQVPEQPTLAASFPGYTSHLRLLVPWSSFISYPTACLKSAELVLLPLGCPG